MTDTNRPEAVHDVLRDMRQWKGDYSVFADRIERTLSARASAGEVGEAVAWRKAYQNGQSGEWRLMPVPSVVLEDANLRNWHGIEYVKFAATPQPATGDDATWEAIDEGGERHYFLREPVGWPNRKPVETPQPEAGASGGGEDDENVREAVDREVRGGRIFYFRHNPPNTMLAQTFNSILLANGTYEVDNAKNAAREEAARAQLGVLATLPTTPASPATGATSLQWYTQGDEMRVSMSEADYRALAAAPQPQEASAQERDDSGPYEFGAGIPDNPKAKYWQDRAYFWRSHAIALGYVAGDGTQHCPPAHGDGEGDDVTETIIRDVCELDPSDPEHHDTVCIKRHHLRQIIKRTLALPAQGEG